ncbi:MAG TPA: hypothetical protein VJT09_03760 [Pyrinomonadaceae bacterium]|nr:hypothetical protein [Pyrinomonadaceae bacterium]
MNRILLFVFLVVVSAIFFLLAFGLDQSALGEHFPPKNQALRKKLFTIGGSVLLLCALLALYAAVMSPR